ncbi:MAG: hypothetical protein ACKO6N_09655 [Myxococcota bacterium]
MKECHAIPRLRRPHFVDVAGRLRILSTYGSRMSGASRMPSQSSPSAV